MFKEPRPGGITEGGASTEKSQKTEALMLQSRPEAAAREKEENQPSKERVLSDHLDPACPWDQ